MGTRRPSWDRHPDRECLADSHQTVITTIMHPTELTDDSIIEALCHLRFRSTGTPEVIIGRLSDAPAWKGFLCQRLPVADIPAPIREQDENLRYEPIIQMVNSDGTRMMRIGGNVVSYHMVGKYQGWGEFRPELEKMLAEVFERVDGLEVSRASFRYVNALTSHRHYIDNVHSLRLNLRVADEPLSCPVNLNYVIENDKLHNTLVRIASPVFVKGSMPENTAAVVDVEVYTPASFGSSQLGELLDWINKAHDFEKDAFFPLLPKEALGKLIKQ